MTYRYSSLFVLSQLQGANMQVQSLNKNIDGIQTLSLMSLLGFIFYVPGDRYAGRARVKEPRSPCYHTPTSPIEMEEARQREGRVNDPWGLGRGSGSTTGVCAFRLNVAVSGECSR